MRQKTATLIEISTLILLILPNFLFSFNTDPKQEEGEYLVVVKNNELIFDAFETAEENIEVFGVQLLEEPAFGQAILNSDYTFSFKPFPDICEEKDAFSYQVTTSKGTETVKVVVEILCEPITFLSGFSPNGDGENDHFEILGVQNFPTNSLAVFNEKGEEIFYQTNYNNEWDGSLAGGEMVEEGLLYYVFHDGGEKYYSGYLQVN